MPLRIQLVAPVNYPAAISNKLTGGQTRPTHERDKPDGDINKPAELWYKPTFQRNKPFITMSSGPAEELARGSMETRATVL